jgi:hypothetical protein
MRTTSFTFFTITRSFNNDYHCHGARRDLGLLGIHESATMVGQCSNKSLKGETEAHRETESFHRFQFVKFPVMRPSLIAHSLCS